jgi:hypothetical protein
MTFFGLFYGGAKARLKANNPERRAARVKVSPLLFSALLFVA